MISADEAKNIQALFSSFGDLSNRELKIRDLAATVVAQAAQIDRVLKVADLLDQMAGDNGRLADSPSSEYAKGKHDAYVRAAEIIREALGDTDD